MSTVDTLAASLKVGITGVLTNPSNIGTRAQNLYYNQIVNLATGTAANQGNALWSLGGGTIAASGTTILNLTSLTDAFGVSTTLLTVKGMMIYAYSTNTNNVLVGGATNPFASWLSSGTAQIIVQPGATFCLMTPNTGYTVTASTAMNLQLANSGSGSSVSYDIILLGTQ